MGNNKEIDVPIYYSNRTNLGTYIGSMLRDLEIPEKPNGRLYLTARKVVEDDVDNKPLVV